MTSIASQTSRFLVLLAVIFAAGCGVAAANDLTIGPKTEIRLLGTADMLVDVSSRLDIREVAAEPPGAWSRHPAISDRAAWEQTAVWYRVTLKRTTMDVFAIAWPGSIGRVDLYWQSGKDFEHLAAGYDVKRQTLTQRVMLLPGRSYGRVLYVRALSGFANTSPRIVTLETALGTDLSLLTLFGGFFLAILLTNLILFFVMHQRSLLVYAGVMAMLLGLLATDDTIWRFIPSTAFVRIFVHDLFGWLYFAGTAIFARTFLNLPQKDPAIDRWLLIATFASIAGIPTDIFEVPKWTDYLAQALLIGLLVLIVAAGIRSSRRGLRAARFLIAGTIGMAIGTIANIGVLEWGLPFARNAQYLFEISIGWEALLVAIAIADRMNDLARENAALQIRGSELRRLVTIDALTGIANRRAFDERLDEEWRRAQRSGTATSMVMVDVDHFKDYNDTFGHIVGDACLSRVALACSGTLKRSSDFFARYGGEEFAAIIVAPVESDLEGIAERMRAAVEAEQIVHPINPGGFVTVSIGAAQISPTSDESAGTLIAAADAALYEAKATGRNRVCITIGTKGPA